MENGEESLEPGVTEMPYRRRGSSCPTPRNPGRASEVRLRKWERSPPPFVLFAWKTRALPRSSMYCFAGWKSGACPLTAGPPGIDGNGALLGQQTRMDDL